MGCCDACANFDVIWHYPYFNSGLPPADPTITKGTDSTTAGSTHVEAHATSKVPYPSDV